MRMEDGRVIVKDELKLKDQHSVTMRFHLDAAIEECQVNETVVIMKRGEKSLKLSLESDTSFNIAIENDTVSPSYGVLQESKTIAVTFNTNHDFIVRSIFN